MIRLAAGMLRSVLHPLVVCPAAASMDAQLSERESFRKSSLQGHADDVAQHNHSGGGQAGRDLLSHKVVQGGVGGDLGVLPRALAHHIDGCSTEQGSHASLLHSEGGRPSI